MIMQNLCPYVGLGVVHKVRHTSEEGVYEGVTVCDRGVKIM